MSSAHLDEAEAILGYRFERRALLDEALTHRSFVNEAGPGDGRQHNERLEFLGDAVLGFVAARSLFADHPDAPEGELTRRRAAYVSEHGIAQSEAAQALGRLVRLGRGQQRSGGHALPSIISDAAEAVIAAVFLDGGLEAAEAVIARLLGPVPTAVGEVVINPKSRLQERLQRLLGAPPSYEAQRRSGPDHAPRFVAVVKVGEVELGDAEGSSKKDATLAAAAHALARIDAIDDDALLTLVDREGVQAAREAGVDDDAS